MSTLSCRAASISRQAIAFVTRMACIPTDTFQSVGARRCVCKPLR